MSLKTGEKKRIANGGIRVLGASKEKGMGRHCGSLSESLKNYSGFV